MTGKLDDFTTLSLVSELNELMKDIQALEVGKLQLDYKKNELINRYNIILEELYKRFPHLESDINMQKKR